jgi:CAAX protease family protein
MKAAHLIVLFIVCMGISDQFVILRLKHNNDPKAKLRAYWLILSWLWLATIAASWITGPRALWFAHLQATEARWLPASVYIWMIAGISLTALFVPLILILRKPSMAAQIARALQKVRFFLPATPRERFWWAMLSITAGVCEETLFRSFLLQYLHARPWHLRLGLTIAIACVLFALGHLYQGIIPAIGTGVLALLFFILFLGSGSLLIPILLHALTDLRVLLLLWLAEAYVPRTASAEGINLSQE